MKKPDVSIVGAIVLLLMGAAFWHLVTLFSLAPAYVIPPPSSVAVALWENIMTLLQDTSVTLGNALIGLVLSGAAAATLAVILIHVRPLRRSLVPLIAGFEAVPKVAFAPLLVVWLGIGSASKVALAAALAFYPLFINILSGLEQVDPHLLQLSSVLRARAARTLLFIRAPNSLIRAFDALRIALPLCLIGAILGEFVSANSGLGYRLLTAFSNLRLDLAFAVLVILAAISMLLFGLLALAEKGAMKWREPL